MTSKCPETWPTSSAVPMCPSAAGSSSRCCGGHPCCLPSWVPAALASAGPLLSLQVLERRSWQGLEEVVRLLNCGELLFAGMEGCGEL